MSVIIITTEMIQNEGLINFPNKLTTLLMPLRDGGADVP